MNPLRGRSHLRLSVRTDTREALVDVTHAVRQAVRRQMNGRDGLAVVYVPHTTAGVCIQENADPDVRRDVVAKLAALFPKDEPMYRHAEGNSDAHLKAILTGTSVTLVVADGDLLLGRWQGIYLCEFDGPRDRELFVKTAADGHAALD